MNCPICHEKLESVNVYSQCLQPSGIDDDGKITWYGNAAVLDTQDIECPNCQSVIKDFITE